MPTLPFLRKGPPTLFPVAALTLTLTAFQPPEASAQSTTVNWSPAWNTNYGCQQFGASHLCPSPAASCSQIADLYSATSHNLSIGSGAGLPQWICNYNAAPFASTVQATCAAYYPPWEYSYQPFAPHGCFRNVYPKSWGKNCTETGNPVTVCNGNKFQEAVDFRSNGTNVLEFVRYYNSQAQYAGKMGIAWRHNFERQLVFVTSSKIYALRADGRQLTYNKSGSVWTTDTDVPQTLTQSGSTYTLTDTDDTQETYNSSGQLTAVTQRNGYVQTLTYTSGKLTSVSDNQNRSLSFAYDSDGFLETMTDPDGEVYTYGYVDAYPSGWGTTLKLISTVTYPNNPSEANPVVTYHYEDADLPTYLTGITDERGNRYATWEYNSAGQVITSEHAGGADLTDVAYNTNGTKTVLGPLGEEITYTFSVIKSAPKVTREDRAAFGTTPAANRQYTYDTNGFLATAKDWKGNETRYVHNSRGLETSRTEAYGTAIARTITTSWHSTFRLPTQIVEPRKTTDFTYDSDGNLETRTETDTTSQSVPYSTNGATRTWTYTYRSFAATKKPVHYFRRSPCTHECRL
jgi:YD repeat-containing protein